LLAGVSHAHKVTATYLRNRPAYRYLVAQRGFAT